MLRLLRDFSVASGVAIVAAAGLLGFAYQHVAVEELLDLGERNNTALAQSFANSLWPRFEAHLRQADAMSADDIRAHPETAALRAAVGQQVRGLKVVKVKIYAMSGRTVFSTEAVQIGEDKRGNAGFVAALAGRPATELVHRESFSAFEQEIFKRDLIQSYVPIRPGGEGAVAGVFELYQDVTDLLTEIRLTRFKVMALVAAILVALYAALFALVKRADHLLQRRDADRKRAENLLRQARDELEQRVRERTAELAQANEDLKREIAIRTRARFELEQAKEAAEAGSRAKSEFLAKMSHELRTPMNGILGMTEVLLDTPLSEAQQGYAQLARESAVALLAVLNDILDYTAIETGGLVPENVAFDPGALVRAVLDDYAERARSKGLALDAQLAADLPARVVGDPGRLRQILANLVDNAVKFTAAGSVEVSARVVDRLALRLRFDVSDSGIGIEASRQAGIFDAFAQVDESSTRRFGGTGMGLAICRQLAERLGGQIAVTSAPGEGSRFRVELPFAAVAVPLPGGAAG